VKVDIQDVIDKSRLGSFNYLLLGATTLVMLVDGFDVFVVGRIAPAIAHGLGEPTSRMSMVFLLQQMGLAAGAFAISPFADKWGRRSVLVVTLAAFGVLTIACAFATSLHNLAVLRGLAGIFLSGAVPTALALLVEMTPQRWRSAFLSISLGAYGLGSALGAGVAAWLLVDYGWQIAFWIGGVAPLVCLALVMPLPESIMFRLGRDPRDPRIARILRRLSSDERLNDDQEFVPPPGPRRGKLTIFEIVSDGRALPTLVMWLCWFIHMGTTALLASWMSTFFLEMGGVPLANFSTSLMIAFIGGTIGTFLIGYLIDRFEWFWPMSIYFGALTLATAALGVVPYYSWAFVLVLTAWSFFQGGGQVGLTALLARLYPANVRSTGLGWGTGVGRLGGVVLPLFGGLALGSKLGLSATFWLIALMPALVLGLLWSLRALRPQALTALAVGASA
jgi:AAHS family 4-hydroxybenzoate transporter-like MFS transporter